MRSLIIGFVIFLSACNDGNSEAQLQALNASLDKQIIANQEKLDSLTKALAAATHESAIRFSSLQLVGKLNEDSTSVNSTNYRTMGEATITPTSFGPCPNMGTFQGRGGTDSGNPLASQFEIFKTCTGYMTSYNESTGQHDVPHYAAWESPGCTGTMVIITDVPQDAMAVGALENGLVLNDPFSGETVTTQSGSVPKPIQIQSAWNILGGFCSADVETRMVVETVPNSVTVSGVAQALIPGSWSITSP